jgi:tRNA(adenine34) deaminase
MGGWRLNGCSLFVTMEPCIMCSGLIVQSRLEKVVFGAYDPKGGGLVSLYNIGSDLRLNHQVEIVGGVLEKECASILSHFFIKRRAENAEKRKGLQK